MINYILQVILFQVLFLAIYDLFLSRETFFTKNRWYLLSTPILSFIIPLIKISSFQKAVSQEYIIYLPEFFLSPEKVIQQTFFEINFSESVNYINILFWIGVAIFSIVFFIKLIKIINLIRENEAIKKSDFILILLPKQTKAFSFFKYIFLGKEIKENQVQKVIQHELVHSKQKHSLDLLFFEFLKIVMWFNPMIYFYQKRITLLHEYISDAVVAKSETKDNYINNLLSNFFQVENISFINQFYKQSLIKKRIMMMTKNKSKKMNQLKYLVLIPVLISMLFYSSCSESFSEDVVTKQEQLTIYTITKTGNLKSFKLDKLSFLDFFMGDETPREFKEISLNSLTNEEKEEYFKIKNRFEEKNKIKLFMTKSGRKVVGKIYSQRFEPKVIKNPHKYLIENEVEVAPTFPDCETGDKKCFSKMIQKHFFKNFNSKIVNKLGLESGRKRIYIGFKIDKDGNIVDVKVKAPHDGIKEEVLNVMSSLPKMIPGELKGGEKVGVQYNFPFTILVE